MYLSLKYHQKNKLLTRPSREEVEYPFERPLPLIRKRRILERAAFQVFANTVERPRMNFDETVILYALAWAAEQEGYHSDRDRMAKALLRDLSQNCGILQGGQEVGYYFLHLTIQEFLAAGAMAALVNESKGSGWQSEIEVEGEVNPVRHVVDRECWDPRWQEVMVLLAGQLKDPGPLLDLLVDKEKEDNSRQRLTLAALCLSEVPDAIRSLDSQRIDELIEARRVIL